MLNYGLKEKDKVQLEHPKSVYTGWGRDSRDYLKLLIYNLNDEKINEIVLRPADVVFTTDTTIDIDVGSHIRELGYREGEFKFQYLFFRYMAGNEDTVFINQKGFINVGKVQTRVVNGKPKYYTVKGGKARLQDELEVKELKYVIKEISPNRDEIKVDVQDISNLKYRRDFAAINKDIVYTPKKINPTDGEIRFDKNDPNVLIFEPATKERGFTDSMVGGQIVIRGMYEYLKVEPETKEPIPTPDLPTDEDNKPQPIKPFLDIIGYKDPIKSLFKPKELIRQNRYTALSSAEEQEAYEEYNRNDTYGSVCFVGDTKIKLSNNRTIPIRLMKPGMKVKTQQGYAKVLKVLKDNKPYGDKLVRFGKLITTDHHPIYHKGKWFMANEIGEEFLSEPLSVWNLLLDKHHTIYANNVVCATMNKWKSDDTKHWSERFFESRNRFKMLRPAGPIPGGGLTGGGFGEDGFESQADLASEEGLGLTVGSGVSAFTPNEIIVEEQLEPVTREFIDDISEKDDIIDDFPPDPSFPRPFPDEEIKKLPKSPTPVPIDYHAKITEVLDYNRVRVDTSYEDGADDAGHSGEDNSRKRFSDWYVNFRKAKIGRLNTYMVSDEGLHLCLSVLDSPDVIDTDDVDLRPLSDQTARYFKLYEPLPDSLEKGDLVYFAEEKMEPYSDVIRLIPFIDDDRDELFLRVPNVESMDNPITFRGTNFKNRTDLIGTDDSTKESITNSVFSSSLLDVQVNVDYQKRTDKFGVDVTDYGFSNFVNFSSAKLRLKNFKKKLELIEFYTSSSSAINDVTGSSDTKSEFDLNKRRIINSFDPYENFLYTVSSSYASSSVGEFYDSSWPKSNSTSPYTLNAVTSSEGISWYNTWINYAEDYDRGNRDRLVNNLPTHITNDTQNKVFVDFMDMIGHQFDETWTYLKHFTDVNERVSKVSEGISKDIVQEVAKSMGFEVINGNDLIILPEYLLGKDIDGGALYESPQETVTEEVWKRILANLPFFMKTKGTKRAIKGLLNCYGIPSSILRVREYGGPDKGTAVGYEVKRKFTYALDFKSNEYLRLPWKDTADSIKPETIEFRFRSPESKNQVIVESEDKWAIELTDNGEPDDKGRLQFSVSGSGATAFITSSVLPFYNDDMWSVMLTRKSASGADLTADTATQNITYELTTRQYDSTRETILYSDSSSISTNTSAINTAFAADTDLYIGGHNDKFHNTRFSGSLMEFRLWSEPLSQSVFENHVRTPKAYNGNTSSSAYDNLELRLTLSDNVNLNTSPSANDNKSGKNLYHTSASAHSFSGNSYRSLVDLEQLKVPNIGPNRRNATKIRIENTSLTGLLSPNIRREQSSQDLAPLDSNKLGIYFSPVDVINEDIMYSVADLNIDDEIGDPRDLYEPTYRGLRKKQREYFKKYSGTNNFWDYMRLIGFYDDSIWRQIGKMVPARANSTLGLLIEPNILERSKQVVGKKPEVKNVYYENANHFEFGLQLSSRETSSIGHQPFSFEGELPQYETELDLNGSDFVSGSTGKLGLPTLIRLNEIDHTSPYGNFYATASITFGGITSDFTDSLQVFVSGSRISEHNEIEVPFYTSSLSVSEANGYGDFPQYKNNGNYQYSSSFEPTDIQSMAYDGNLFRAFVQGTLLTKDNTIDGNEPVEITITSPGKLVTQNSGESKLKVD